LKFLVDANLPFSCKELLEKLGLNARHVREVGLGSASDEAVFNYAQKTGRVIITRDLDFADAVKFVPGKHYGIIVMRISYVMTASQINGILKNFLQNVSFNKIRRGLVILEMGRYRLRRA
jgi:predicted nuclease of predicted toxin-antitoxin system